MVDGAEAAGTRRMSYAVLTAADCAAHQLSEREVERGSRVSFECSGVAERVFVLFCMVLVWDFKIFLQTCHGWPEHLRLSPQVPCYSSRVLKK
jgi:hypothetical protein